MATTLAEHASGKGLFKAWHALLWFIGFFGFMFVVNGIFLWTAIQTFPGEEVEKSYAAGLDYNATLARRSLQAAKGWQAEIGLEEKGLRIRLLTRDFTPLSASSIKVVLRHPADRNLDQQIELLQTGTGNYFTSATDIPPGLWTVRVSADVDPAQEGADFEAERELLIP